MDLPELQRTAYEIAAGSGFHEPRMIDGVVRDASFAERIALCHKELTEALQCYRKDGHVQAAYYEVDGKPEGVIAELADVVIRIADLAETYGLDLEKAVLTKMEFNRTRERFHGKAVL